MPELPAPLRAALGLAAVAFDEARTAPTKIVEIPVAAISTVLQFSLRAQQQYAALTARGDEVLGHLRGIPDEPPSWATFDDDPVESDEDPVESDDDPVESGTDQAVPAGSDAAATPVDEAPAATSSLAADVAATIAESAEAAAAEESSTAATNARLSGVGKRGKPTKTTPTKTTPTKTPATKTTATKATAAKKVTPRKTTPTKSGPDADDAAEPDANGGSRRPPSAKAIPVPRTGRPSAFDAIDIDDDTDEDPSGPEADHRPGSAGH